MTYPVYLRCALLGAVVSACGSNSPSTVDSGVADASPPDALVIVDARPDARPDANHGDTAIATLSVDGAANVVVNGSRVFSVTFTTDDGNTATDFQITSGINPTPPGWSVDSPIFTCNSINTGASCKVNLTYAPTSVQSDTLTLNFAYSDSAGADKDGSIDIVYASSVAVYVTDGSNVELCSLADGAIANCAATAAGLPSAAAMAFNVSSGQTYAYVTEFANGVAVCPVAGDGSLSMCVDSGQEFEAAVGIAILGGSAYVSNASNNTVEQCTISDVDGAFSACTSSGAGFSDPGSVATNDGYVYVSNSGAGDVSMCNVDGITGELVNCVAQPGFVDPVSIILSGGFAYVADSSTDAVDVCTVLGDGSFSSCAATASDTGTPTAVGVVGGSGYVGTAAGLSQCAIDGGTGLWSSCAADNIGVQEILAIVSP